MSETDFISPVSIKGPYINKSSIFVSQQGPEEGGEIFCDVNIELHDKTDAVNKGNEYVLPHRMEVNISLHSAEGDGGRIDYMRAHLDMVGIISIPNSIEIQGMTATEALRLNGISLLYSSARSYIEFLTSMSAMGRFTIPAIDPAAFLHSLND